MAGHNYSINHKTASGTNLTILCIVGVSTRRYWTKDLWVSSSSAPGDTTSELNVIRGTVSGTGTGVTPRILDPGNPAALTAGEGGTFTGQTKTASSSLLDISVNQRATVRWMAYPEGELVGPATSDNWIGVESIANASVPVINCTIHYME